MIYQTIENASQFRDAFRAMGRQDQFSYEGSQILFDYLEDCGEDIDLDVIALCCDFCEESPEEISNNYGIEVSEVENMLEYKSGWYNKLGNGNFIYQQF